MTVYICVHKLTHARQKFETTLQIRCPEEAQPLTPTYILFSLNLFHENLGPTPNVKQNANVSVWIIDLSFFSFTDSDNNY